MLWDQDCMNLIGVSATDLRKKMIKVEEMVNIYNLTYFTKKIIVNNLVIFYFVVLVLYQDGEDDPKCFPEDLDVILGCTWAFKVKLQEKN